MALKTAAWERDELVRYMQGKLQELKLPVVFIKWELTHTENFIRIVVTFKNSLVLQFRLYPDKFIAGNKLEIDDLVQRIADAYDTELEKELERLEEQEEVKDEWFGIKQKASESIKIRKPIVEAKKEMDRIEIAEMLRIAKGEMDKKYEMQQAAKDYVERHFKEKQ